MRRMSNLPDGLRCVYDPTWVTNRYKGQMKGVICNLSTIVGYKLYIFLASLLSIGPVISSEREKATMTRDFEASNAPHCKVQL